jgi:hypothetical protein
MKIMCLFKKTREEVLIAYVKNEYDEYRRDLHESSKKNKQDFNLYQRFLVDYNPEYTEKIFMLYLDRCKWRHSMSFC